jgi:hypothetical protein
MPNSCNTRRSAPNAKTEVRRRTFKQTRMAVAGHRTMPACVQSKDNTQAQIKRRCNDQSMLHDTVMCKRTLTHAVHRYRQDTDTSRGHELHGKGVTNAGHNSPLAPAVDSTFMRR